MKLILVIMFVLANGAATAWADECGQNFLDGEIAQTTGDNKFEAAAEEFRQAWDLDEEDPANHPQICLHIRTSAEFFTVAAEYYQNAMLSFVAAVEYCEPEREAEAAERVVYNSERHDQSREFGETLSVNPPEYCN